MLPDTTVSVVSSVCDHGKAVRSTRCGCPSTSVQTRIPPCPTEPDNSYVTRLIVNSGGAAGSLTVMTGGGLESRCTFNMATAPKASATTATKGIQTRAKTVRPTERGLTRSPPRLDHLSESGTPPRVLGTSPTFVHARQDPGPYINKVDI